MAYCSLSLVSSLKGDFKLSHFLSSSIFVMDSARKAPEDKLPSASRASYADIVKTNLPLEDDWWRRFQAKDEDEAVDKALEASLQDAKVSFFLFCLSSGSTSFATNKASIKTTELIFTLISCSQEAHCPAAVYFSYNYPCLFTAHSSL